jgi:copper resistance protein C
MMFRSISRIVGAAVIMFSVLAAREAFGHALLQHSNPPVGGSVSGSPSSIQLEFTQGVEARYSHVSITGPGGEVQVSSPTNGGAKSTLVVRLGKGLKPGSYHVHWSVLSVDTHKTQGSFSFEVR